MSSLRALVYYWYPTLFSFTKWHSESFYSEHNHLRVCTEHSPGWFNYFWMLFCPQNVGLRTLAACLVFHSCSLCTLQDFPRNRLEVYNLLLLLEGMLPLCLFSKQLTSPDECVKADGYIFLFCFFTTVLSPYCLWNLGIPLIKLNYRNL